MAEVDEKYCGEVQKRVDERAKMDEDRILASEKEIDKLSDLSAQMCELLKHVTKEQDVQHNDVEELKLKPAKRWDYVVNVVLQWAVLAALAAIQLFGRH